MGDTLPPDLVTLARVKQSRFWLEHAQQTPAQVLATLEKDNRFHDGMQHERNVLAAPVHVIARQLTTERARRIAAERRITELEAEIAALRREAQGEEADPNECPRYWLTPPDVYSKLDEEFHFTFDPCPYPLPEGHNALEIAWGVSNFVNGPFRKADVINGTGLTAFVYKAIEEAKLGRSSVLLVPTFGLVNLALEHGAELRSLGRVAWLECDTKLPHPSPPPTLAIIFRGHQV
jgi:hypothetical protein